MERAGGLMTDGFGHNRANAPLCGYAWGRRVMKPWGRFGEFIAMVLYAWMALTMRNVRLVKPRSSDESIASGVASATFSP